jgi:hypothetical protein
MADIKRDIKHLNKDVRLIHDRLEHLNAHSKICNELVRESNLREASELFEHLNEIDKLVHGVQEHIIHIKDHLENDSKFTPDEAILDIDDLKQDASHTSLDLKDIHLHIEHLITHTEMCQDIIKPLAEQELMEIQNHLTEIDDQAHELLDHINEIRGELSTKYSEFIWSIPEGMEEFLKPTTLVENHNESVKSMALKLVDGSETLEDAIIRILCFTRDFIKPSTSTSPKYSNASITLEKFSGSSFAKSILICSLARAVSIPTSIHFARLKKEYCLRIQMWTTKSYPDPDDELSISWPEFYLNNKWFTASQIMTECNPDIEIYHEKFYDLGIPPLKRRLNPNKWDKISKDDLLDDGVFSDPSEYLENELYKSPPLDIDNRLFAGFIYTNEI